ncbi:MAG TPA: hypothetical protein VMS09_08950 [Paenibacillus sp.]|uniref:hypothetical protein n=1 Tax=Paenibacillus sp. TaxID=58172 RepID=UPI002BDDC5FB|nr:hypothetical protein [Paenibacillus sp.]HUC92141.1 hypothetical protein [Paenibacillus sp.]
MDKKIGRPALLAAILIALVTLTGCVKGEAGIYVRANGSADVAMTVRLPIKVEEAAPGVFERIGARLKATGYVTNIREVGDVVEWSASRHYTRSELMRYPTDGQGFRLDVPGFRVELGRNDGWLYNTYRLEGAFEPEELLGASNEIAARYQALPPLARRLAERQIELDLKLSLPIPPADHNADESSRAGRTLIWHVSPTGDTPFRIAVAAPNGRTAVAAGIALLLIAAGLWLPIRRLRHKRPAPERKG